MLPKEENFFEHNNIQNSPESPGQVPYGLASLPTQITDLLLNNCGKAKEISEAYVELE